MGRVALGLIVVGFGIICLLGVASNIQSKMDQGISGERTHLLWLGHKHLFGDLERPPVPFDHDGHTKALGANDCKVCHILEKDVQGETIRVYEFPREKESHTPGGLMKAYHRACMSCHKENLEAGRKAGPATCGECHSEISPQTAPWEPMEYDYAIHHKHSQALESKCELCHHVYDEEQRKLIYRKGEESSCRDCHGVQDEENRRSFRHVSHAHCLDCHMNREKEGFVSGPNVCAGCHGAREKMSTAEMARLPRLFRDQKDQILMKIENGRMKAIPFDHRAHEGRVRFCRDCHHTTQQACSKCHTMPGSPEGAGVALEAAFHDPLSRWSCNGCHSAQKRSLDCMGCHMYEDKSAIERSCALCHTGTWGSPRQEAIIRLMDELPEEKVPEKVEIKILESQYEPVVMPHRQMVKRLINASKENQLADHFHANSPAICLGCHHGGPLDLQEKPPSCSSCHGIIRNTRTLGRPRLMGAYHRQCMGCHEEMKIKAIGCEDCHKEKPSKSQEASQMVRQPEG